MDEQICYYNDGVPVTVAEVAEMARNGETTAERCPNCDYEAEISVTGGYCPECGHWLIPCSMCDAMLNCVKDDGRPCPFECFRPKEDKMKEEEKMSKLKTCKETCPKCGKEIEIPIVGGKCLECGQWVKPCAVCRWSGSDCGHCPYKEGDTVTGYLEKVLEKVNESIRVLAEAETPYIRATDNPLDNKVHSAVVDLRKLRDAIEDEKPTTKVIMYKVVRYRKLIDVPAEVAREIDDDDASALDVYLQDHPDKANFDEETDYDCTLENWSEVL